MLSGGRGLSPTRSSAINIAENRCKMNTTIRAQADFDEIALLTDSGRRDRYDALLLSLIPDHAVRVLDIGCGLGGLTLAMARENREVVGIDPDPANC
jgi:2-polyprenyl-3-methyl-5-hydroxy-6-metoxy-1,4-benzoquinol methylase